MNNDKSLEEFKKIFPDEFDGIKLLFDASNFDNFNEFVNYNIQEYFLFLELDKTVSNNKIEIINLSSIKRRKTTNIFVIYF